MLCPGLTWSDVDLPEVKRGGRDVLRLCVSLRQKSCSDSRRSQRRHASIQIDEEGSDTERPRNRNGGVLSLYGNARWLQVEHPERGVRGRQQVTGQPIKSTGGDVGQAGSYRHTGGGRQEVIGGGRQDVWTLTCESAAHSTHIVAKSTRTPSIPPSRGACGAVGDHSAMWVHVDRAPRDPVWGGG